MNAYAITELVVYCVWIVLGCIFIYYIVAHLRAYASTLTNASATPDTDTTKSTTSTSASTSASTKDLDVKMSYKDILTKTLMGESWAEKLLVLLLLYIVFRLVEDMYHIIKIIFMSKSSDDDE
jgi:uncharacterized MAPEG superfamily protein